MKKDQRTCPDVDYGLSFHSINRLCCKPCHRMYNSMYTYYEKLHKRLKIQVCTGDSVLNVIYTHALTRIEGGDPLSKQITVQLGLQ